MTRIAYIATIALLAALHASGANRDVPVIDCHVHLWDTSRPEMTWPRKEHTDLYKSFLPATHEPICQANKISGVVVVLSGQALADNQWNLDVTAHNTRLYRGVVGNLSTVIGTDAFKPLFLKLCKDKRYVGYRLSGRYQDGLDALLRDLRLTAKMGRTVDFLVGGYSLEDVDTIAARIPELRIIVDHFGSVRLGGPALDAEWVNAFRTVAKRTNVYCKLSALYGRFQKQPAPTDLATYTPVIDLALECFGPKRVIYGSDWPVTTRTGDYQSVITLTKAYFADKDPTLARRVFHDNAIAFYGIANYEATPE